MLTLMLKGRIRSWAELASAIRTSLSPNMTWNGVLSAFEHSIIATIPSTAETAAVQQLFPFLFFSSVIKFHLEQSFRLRYQFHAAIILRFPDRKAAWKFIHSCVVAVGHNQRRKFMFP